MLRIELMRYFYRKSYKNSPSICFGWISIRTSCDTLLIIIFSKVAVTFL